MLVYPCQFMTRCRTLYFLVWCMPSHAMRSCPVLFPREPHLIWDSVRRLFPPRNRRLYTGGSSRDKLKHPQLGMPDTTQANVAPSREAERVRTFCLLIWISLNCHEYDGYDSVLSKVFDLLVGSVGSRPSILRIHDCLSPAVLSSRDMRHHQPRFPLLGLFSTGSPRQLPT
ncbi:hypothetical protein BO85DRAFT_119260 [Aspergillus piperis CBS 112811]|uniref:Uncharacterized protein n=1 Tax=Aspergillus piperis CBS 112811 TaxID=1448313 RepID=A0A8G1RBV2_9EURO|nr:hypothetical protein BO85DRAFT_119260 [Aspergillus piperis CBS 112811]RAH61859.1 hypothetical protein BO85DRAFT_119260 [Aspergillus piperis CBS 112811]